MGQARETGPVRIFGELVAVLWADGSTRAAIRLEELWNKFATEQPSSRLCAYPLGKVSGKEVLDSVLAISPIAYAYTYSITHQCPS
jgi:hypothetical protein